MKPFADKYLADGAARMAELNRLIAESAPEPDPPPVTVGEPTKHYAEGRPSRPRKKPFVNGRERKKKPALTPNQEALKSLVQSRKRLAGLRNEVDGLRAAVKAAEEERVKLVTRLEKRARKAKARRAAEEARTIENEPRPCFICGHLGWCRHRERV